MLLNDAKERLRHGMFGNKNGAAVLVRLNGGLIGFDFLGDRDDIFLVKRN